MKLLVGLVIGLSIGYLLFRSPLPFFERGHRAFAVFNERAAIALELVLRETTGTRELFTFDSGPTHQTLLFDGFTVLMRLDEEMYQEGFTGNAMSFPVEDPQAAADQAVQLLREAGFEAEAFEQTVDLGPNMLYVIKTNALRSSELVFRLHVMKMEKIKKRKIS